MSEKNTNDGQNIVDKPQQQKERWLNKQMPLVFGLSVFVLLILVTLLMSLSR